MGPTMSIPFEWGGYIWTQSGLGVGHMDQDDPEQE